ncbi:MAG: hypothetical protein V2A73_16705 [Pseudomonadota bacterium]
MAIFRPEAEKRALPFISGPHYDHLDDLRGFVRQELHVLDVNRPQKRARQRTRIKSKSWLAEAVAEIEPIRLGWSDWLSFLVLTALSAGLVLPLGILYGSLSEPDGGYFWTLVPASLLCIAFLAAGRLLRVRRTLFMLPFTFVTAILSFGYGHISAYETKVFNVYVRLTTPSSNDFVAEWKDLDRNEVYRRYLSRETGRSSTGGLLDYLRYTADRGARIRGTPKLGHVPYQRRGFLIWLDWGVQGAMFLIAALFGSLRFPKQDRKTSTL